jgi:tRNA (Thr-GGU) A37 N-methylase
MKKIEIAPIGKVHADDRKGSYVLRIDPAYRDGLLALSEFGRIHVLWWANGVDEPKLRGTLTYELPYAPGTRAGAFACRSPSRPNPIAMTCCGILEVREKEGIVVLDYIDAAEGTPLLDIKPYIPVSDRARAFKVPAWFGTWPEWMEDAGEFFSGPNAPKT